MDGVRRFRETHFNFVIEYVIKREKNFTGTAGSNPIHFLPNNILSVIDQILEQSETGMKQCESHTSLYTEYSKFKTLI